jgi:hypothetical protein
MAIGRKRDSIHETPDVSHITNPDVMHEESDVAVRPLLWFVGGLTAFTIVVCVVVLLMFIYFQRREESQELEASPLARQGEERLPPKPRLQLAPGFGVTTDDGQTHKLDYTTKTDHAPQPQDEYLTVRKEWQRELKEFGWADQQASTVRVPVEQAMQLYLQRHPTGSNVAGGAPKPGTQQGATSQSGGQGTPTEAVPSDSSSGRQPDQRQP